MSERERLMYFSTQQMAFPMFFSFVVKFHEQMPELAGQMYDALLEQKGLIAASAASMRAAVEASGDPQAVAMLDKLSSDRAQMAALVETDAGNTANHQAQINQLGDEANTVEQSLMKRSVALGRQRAQNAATWRDVQKALKPGESAVEVTRFQFNTGITPTRQSSFTRPSSLRPIASSPRWSYWARRKISKRARCWPFVAMSAKHAASRLKKSRRRRGRLRQLRKRGRHTQRSGSPWSRRSARLSACTFRLTEC